MQVSLKMGLLKLLCFVQIMAIYADVQTWSSDLCHLINQESKIHHVGIYQSNLNQNTTDLTNQILSKLEPSKTVILGISENLKMFPDFVIYYLNSIFFVS